MSDPRTWASEKTVADALAGLDPKGFLPSYVRHAMTRTDAPAVYHIGGALSVLASIIPRTMSVPGLPGAKPVPGNVFCLLVGRQGADRKSTAVEIAQQLLAEFDARRDGSDPGSAEAFDLSVSDAQQPQQTIFFSEMGDFFAKTKERVGGNYGTEVKTRLLRHFDRGSINKVYMKRRVTSVLPHVSILGGINPALLVSHVPLSDWLNGLMSRFLVFWGRAERSLSRTSISTVEEKWLKEAGEYALSFPAEKYGCCLGLSTAAHELWEVWDKEMQDTKEDGIGSSVVGARARAPYLAIRIALLVAFGEGLGWPAAPAFPNPGPVASGRPFFLTTRHMVAAMKIATMAYTGSVLIAEHATEDKDMQARRAVLDAVRTEWTPLGEITHGAKLLKHRTVPILQTLQEEGFIEAEGTVQKTAKGRAQHYRKVAELAEIGLSIVQVSIPEPKGDDPEEAMTPEAREAVLPTGTLFTLPPVPERSRPPTQPSRSVQGDMEADETVRPPMEDVEGAGAAALEQLRMMSGQFARRTPIEE